MDRRHWREVKARVKRRISFAFSFHIKSSRRSIPFYSTAMAKKRGTTRAAKSKIATTTTNGGKKKSFTKSTTNHAQVSVSSLLQNSTKPEHNVSVVETLVPGHVFVSRNFLSKQTCQALIQMAESSGEMEHVAHPATRHIANRECGRWQQTDKDAARLLFQRTLPILTRMNLDCFPSDYQPVACNSNLRLYKYEKTMSFGKHYDGSHTVEEGETEITVLVYLSDDCVGGATRFYPPTHQKSSVAFEPEEGAILLHIHGDQCLQHEADPVVSGIKYVLRTDVVYAKQPP